MNFRASFLICQNADDNEPNILFEKNKFGFYELPTFEMEFGEYDVDKFVSEKFKYITGVDPIDKNGLGWINLFLTSTIIYNEKYSFVYMCKVPDNLKIEKYEKIKMSSLLSSENFEEKYISQVVYAFNNLYIR